MESNKKEISITIEDLRKGNFDGFETETAYLINLPECFPKENNLSSVVLEYE